MISVVIPLYNKKHTIASTLKTVLSQTVSDYEVVIVDDGSTDGGAEYIQECFTDPRIRIIKQQNQGVSVARNVGVDNSKYEYIAFLDGDDEWLPSYLFKIKEAIEKYPEAGMYCCAGYVRNNSGTYLRLAGKYKNKILEVNYFENPHVFSHTSATVVSKKVFNKTKGFPVGMKLNQDYALFFSIAFLSSVVYIGYALSVYVGDVDGQATKASKAKGFQMFKHVVERLNLSYRKWLNSKRVNNLYMIFTKYEIRAILLSLIKDNNYQSIGYFYSNLDRDLLSNFSFIENKIIKNKMCKRISLVYIYLTKIVWRLHGFPRVKCIKVKENQ
ncbi:MAG: glycosyltransferase family 2 protein [Bacteroidales bacterium]|nr:glycosyltransferase family 2 protein [Bacteroidales bacterium]